MNIEPVTYKQHGAIMRAVEGSHGRIGLLVSGLPEADLTKGRGVLDGDARCLWTKDGRRITIIPSSDGGLAVSCGKEPDPECP